MSFNLSPEQVVDHLDNLEEVVPLLKELGGRHGHNGYNINPKFFPVSSHAIEQTPEC